MNADAQQLGLRDTHFANPIGLDAPTNYSTAADLAKLAVVLRRNDFARETMDRRARDPADRRARAHRRQPQHARRRSTRGSTGSRRATRTPPATCSSARRPRNGVTVVSVVMGEPQRGGAGRGLADAPALRPQQLHAGTGLRKGAVLARPKLALPRRARRPRRLLGGPGGSSRRGQRFTVSVAGRPGRAARADPRRGRGSAPRSCACGGRVVGRVPLLTADAGQHGLGRRPLQGCQRSRDRRRGRRAARGR